MSLKPISCKWPLRKTLKAKDISTMTTRLARNASPVLSSGFLSANRELKINDAATPRRGVNMYDKKKVFWNLMSVTTV